jgi:hypothetical protein
MAETPEETQCRLVIEHLATALARTRAAYLKALDDALQFVIDEATTPTRRGQFSPGAAYMATPSETIWSRFQTDQHLTTWEAGATNATPHRLNRSDLRDAAQRLGLLAALPELGKP